MALEQDRRETFRMVFQPEAVCRLNENNISYTGKIRDISMLSLFLEVENCPAISGKCDARIILKRQHSRLIIDNLEGSIIRSDDQGIAIQFDQPLEWFNVVPLYFNKLQNFNDSQNP